jgi:type IV secretory pathway VirB2 component (pilin)
LENKQGNTMRNMMNKMIYLICYLWPTFVLANGETPVSDGLGYIINAMYGATGVAIATISVMLVGLLCLGHFCKWSTFGYTIMGICIIFGAPAIVNGITRLIHF